MSRFVLLAGPAFSVIATAAFAASEEVIVTASRIDQPAYAVGGSFSIVTGEELEQRQTQFVSDALRAVPGLAVNRSGGFGAQTQLRIRGAESNMTLVLIDGVKVNAPADFGNDFDFGNLLALDIDRIEVLRGAQSSVWGSSAIGGVVNVVTREPERGLSGHASFEGGFFDTTNYKARLSYGGERFAASLGGSLFHSHGLSTAEGGRERDGARNGSANGRVRLDITENLSVTLMGRYINSKLDLDDPPSDSDGVQHLNQRWGNATVRLKLLDGHIENIASASLLDIKSSNESASSGSVFSNRGDKQVFSDQINFYADSHFVLPATHRLTLLAEYERDAGASTFFTPFFVSANPLRATKNLGYVAEYAIGIAGRLFLTGSIRRDDNNHFADTTTYRATAAFRIPSWGTRFHGSYGTGVENPTFFELYGFTSSFVGNPSLQPETSRSVDFGVEQSFFDNRLKLDATVFQNRINNRINGAGPTARNIPGDTNILGIEVAATALIMANLTVDASYTALDTADPNGLELTRRPRQSGSAYLNYAMPELGANLNLGVVYKGRSRDQDFCGPSGGFCTFPFPAPYANLRGFTLVTLAGSYDVTPYVRIHARLENALDQHYQEVLYFAAPRIAAYGGIAVKFGD